MGFKLKVTIQKRMNKIRGLRWLVKKWLQTKAKKFCQTTI
jgi:hypothetical protein